VTAAVEDRTYDEPVTREDLIVIVGAVLVPLLLMALFIWSAIAVSRVPRGRRHYTFAMVAFSLLTVSGLAIVFWFWGVGFDYADSLRPPPDYVDRFMLLGLWTAGGAYVAVLGTGVLAHRARRPNSAVA
jgi:hypothetical protein